MDEKRGNKRIWIGMTVFIIATAVLCAAMILLTPVGGDGLHFTFFESGEALLRNTTELSVDDPIRLEISDDAQSIYLYESDDDSMVIKEYYKSERHPLAAIGHTGDTVTITGKDYNEIMIFGWTTGGGNRTEIYLPKGCLNEINAVVTSGDIRSQIALDGAGLSLQTTSGDISWEEEIKAEDIQIEVTSGEIRLFHVSGDAMLHGTSGDITVDGLEGIVEADTTSGEIKLMNVNGAIKATVASGDIRLGMIGFTGDIEAQTTSGEINLSVPEDSSFDFEASCTSGDISTGFDDMLDYNSRGSHAAGTVGADPQHTITLKTGSGDVRATYVNSSRN